MVEVVEMMEYEYGGEELEFEVKEVIPASAVEENEFETIGTLEKLEVLQTKFGQSIRWWFRVQYGDMEGLVSGLTSTRISTASKAYNWFIALGGSVRDGKIKLNEVIGNQAIVKVVKRSNEKGTQFLNVVDVKPLVPKKGRRK